MSGSRRADLETAIAIVGLAGRFPGARNVDELWQLLASGREAIRPLSRQEAAAQGATEAELADPSFVRVVARPEGIEDFDAPFFGFNPREAEILDPQQRFLLEVAWEAIEDAGYDPLALPGLTGVFAGATTSTYLLFHLLPNGELRRAVDPLELLVGNTADSLATRLSFKLNLEGPSYSIASACSSSLVAVHNACQSLFQEECDVAVVGGVSINLSHSAGYRHTPQSILSPDGHCRAFSKEAAGTVFGSGIGVVVLKRAVDAVRDGDPIRALILGSSLNNDGAGKVGYTAPAVDGQAAVIAEALGAAGISARDLSYLEAHGTGTHLGDPIEIQAIRRAFRADTDERGFCGIGSIKTNLGHLDIAAGVAGLIKTVLALEHHQLPPSLHFDAPNPEIDFAASPVYVVKELQSWESSNGPRRAGVSSFGIGGTNAHVVLEEAPPLAPASRPSRTLQVLPLSAKTDTALAAAAERLARFLASRPELELADVAFTLQEGRHTFPRRRAVVATSLAEALELLTSSTPLALAASAQGGEEAELARRFVAGEGVSWAPLRAAGERRRRLSLPPYSFDRHRYWIEAPKAGEWGRAEEVSSLSIASSLHPRPPLETPFVAPRNAEEETLAALWRELLGLAEVGADDNFFELGGHSLLGTRLLARLRADQEVELPLDALFEAPTLAELARRVASSRPVERESAAPRSPFRRTDGLPVASLAQERLWFIDRLEPGNPVYNEARALRLQGKLPPRGVEALAASLSAIVERHQALRTTFTEEAGEPRARLAHSIRVRVPVVDVSGVEGATGSRECFARVAFDLGRAPLLRVCLLRLGDDEHQALFSIHHIAADGWSMGVLVAELAALYPAFLAGETPHLAPLPIQYSDYAAWQRSELSGERLVAELSAVQARLAGAPTVLELPTDRPRPAQASPDGAVVPVGFGRELSARVSELARRENATPFMVLATTFAALLGRLSGQPELLLGTPVANRRHPELEGLIGFFVNTLVIRASTGQGRADTPSWRELLAEVKAGSLFAFAHQDLPFDRLVEVVSSGRDLSRPPVVQAMLGLHNVPAPSLELPGLVLHPEPLHPGTAKFELNLSLTETTEGLSGELEFATALFDATTARRWARAFESLLRAFVAAPEAPVAKAPWLSNTERHQLLEWNDTRRPYPRGLLLDGLILEQATRTPEALALWFEDEGLSYEALAQTSGEIAAELARRGVGPGVPVGVRAERSLLLPVELFAVLRAGGAYVPLDPELPEARLSGMVEDARVAVRLTGGLCEGRVGEVSSTPRDEADPAYIIFTSGSTGRPKGAANSHAGIVNRLLWMQEQYGLGAGDRVLQKTPASFDVSVWEFFWPLLSGACLVVAKPGGHRDSGYLARTIGEHRITTLHFVPSMLQTFLEEPDLLGMDSVRRVIASGEALPGELASRAAERFAAPLWNLYGPTEAAVDVTYELAPRTGSGAVPIGRPVANTQVVVLDRALEPCPIGVPGELYLGGIQVGGGYLGRPALTADRFVPDSLTGTRGRRLYKTGDRVRHLADGRIDFLGRLDFQVKVRGQRIELGEIEAALLSHPEIAEARVKVLGEGLESRLVAYFVPRDSPLDEGRRGDACVAFLAADKTPGQRATHASPLRAYLAARLPEVMIPAVWMELESFPRTASGKVDLNALPEPARGEGLAAGDADAPPTGRIEAAVAAVWTEVLGLPAVGAQQNFFELGGHSLLLPKVLARLKETLPGERVARLTLIDLFRHPTVRSLARALAPHGEEPESLARGRERARARRQALRRDDVSIAIIGLAGRFPGATDPAALWDLVAAGREGITFPTDEELLAQGLSPEALADPHFVKVMALPEGVELFDASFFGFSAREAEILDPQQRLLLELAWEGLEHAGYEPASVAASTGVFAGAATSSYLLYNLLPNLLMPNGSGEGLAPLQLLFGNQGDAAATRISYQLDLKGPSRTLLSACSTSLLAVHEACQSLLAGGCDLALAGGASLPVGHRFGYRHEEGSIASPDGHCRPFDAAASGTIFGGGGGLVVLKRLADALADGDTVHAVLLGTAANNDGAAKVGYTAPSVAGQAAVVAEALSFAGVPASSLTYLEAHGTGTRLGDPVEVQALHDVFRAESDTVGACALGSVKSNVGHLDTAAGITGLAKVVLALGHEAIPPSLHFENPNPEIDFETSPFFVARELSPWRRNGRPRRAGVSSFGIGGTNVHAVVEEAPAVPAGDPHARAWLIFPLSARSPAALEAATVRLAEHLRNRPDLDLADLAFTLGVGRRSFAYRRVVVAANREELLAALSGSAPERVLTAAAPAPQVEPEVAFLLSGQGSQHPGMGRDLYREEPVFRDALDRAAALLEPELPVPLLELLFPSIDPEAAAARLTRTDLAQPALFAFEFALTALWRSWGITPTALLGHSLGEYVAACLAGTMRFEDALRLVALRGRLMAELPAGGMLAVSLAEEVVRSRLAHRPALALAAVNEPGRVVVSGPHGELAALEEELFEAGVACRSLHTSHAFHSPMMDPILGRFEAAVASVPLAAPRQPWVANLTGTWITPEQATSPAYWAEHLRGTVRFADGLSCLAEGGHRLLLEVGPGNALASLARATLPGAAVAASCRHPREAGSDQQAALTAFARLWLAGHPVSFARLYAGERRRRVPLPTYPFERRRYWIDPPAGALGSGMTPRPVVEHATTAEASTLEAKTPEARSFHPRPAVLTPYEPPLGELESTLVGLWQELLGVAPIGRRDSFFELGGHSLLGIQLMSRLKERFGVAPTLTEIFEAPLLADFARRLAACVLKPEAVPEPVADTLAELEPGVEESTTLSFAEERLWFLARLEPESSAYNLPFALRFEGDLSVALCQRAFVEVSRRHQALRTTFHERGGAPLARVWPRLSPGFGVVDLAGLGEDQRAGRARRLLEIEAVRVFDLERGPLLRVSFLRLADREHWTLVTLHHIIADGWSLGVLVEELTTLYRALALGQPSLLPELPISMRQVAARERQLLAGPHLEELTTFWRQALAGAPAAIELPTDRPRPALASYQAGFAPLSLDAAAVRRMASFAEAAGSSVFMVVLAAFQAYLGRLTAQRDVVVGSPIAGRERLETEGLIGLFVNTLVLRGRLVDETSGQARSFRELVAEARETSLAAFSHAEMPFEKLVDELRLERSLTHNPIFQVMLSFQNTPAGALELPGLRLVPIETHADAAKFDLQLTLWEQGGGLEGNLEFKRALFDATTAERWCRQLKQLLEAALATPNEPTSRLPWLSAAERHQLVEWNDTTRPYPRPSERGMLLDELILEQAARTPEALALWFEDEGMSYAALGETSAAIAAELVPRGVGPGVPVGVRAERSLLLPVELLAVLRSGGAYVPLDPELPEARIQGMVEDARVSVRLAGGLCEGGRESGIPAVPPPRDEADPAYIIFTSGSTGRPKGAANTHAGIVNRLLWMQEQYGLGADDRVLQKTPASFDVSVWEFFWPLLSGACLVVAQPGGHRDSGYLARTIAEHRITTLHFVPSMLQAFLEEPDLSGMDSVCRVIASGEALPGELASRATERIAAPLWNLYGPTEAAVDVTYELAPRSGSGAVPIGRPVANTQVVVLDRTFEPCPIGVPGELYLGGIQVGGGYLGRPALTADRFVPDSLTGTRGRRLYKTGDRVRHLADGRIDFLGRLDFQVKIRGLRIELGEIEAALLSHGAVREARVLARPDGAGGLQLVAYFVPREGAAGDRRSTLRALLAERLPEYMIPTAWVELAAFPLNPSGKVDLKALPAPEAERASFEAPRPGFETELAELWRELLRVEKIGRSDSFFALGGHSLMATRLLVRLRSHFGIHLELRQVFNTPTLAALAAALEAARITPPPPIAPEPAVATIEIIPPPPSLAPPTTIPRRDPKEPVPLTLAQESLYFLDRFGQGSSVYNIPGAFLLEGRLDAEVLVGAFADLVARHESLRTRFVEIEGEGRPMLRPAGDRGAFDFRVLDLGALEGPERDGFAARLSQLEASRPFDLEQGPLLRVMLLLLQRSLPTQRARLLVVQHHIVSDGWSLGVLATELVACFSARLEGRENPLPPLPIEISDFACWQRRTLGTDALEAQLAFWRQELAGAPAELEMPTDRPRPARLDNSGFVRSFRLPAPALARLEALAAEEGATLFMVLLAAYQLLLARWSGQRDLNVGAPIANRSLAELEGLIGFFVNTLVFRGRLDGNPSFRELLRDTRTHAFAAFAHPDLPFDRLVETLQPERNPASTPLFQVALSVQNFPYSDPEVSGLKVKALDLTTGNAKFDLALTAARQEESLAGWLEVRRSLFDTSSIDRLLEAFRVLLEGVGDAPERRLSELPLLSLSLRHQLVFEWNDTDADFPAETLVHRLFEEQVARAPEATAVAWCGELLSYGELNGRANRRARQLVALGVGRDGVGEPVALCLERSPELVVAELAILKAGGAYVPLDLAYPPERLSILLEDSGARVLLTTEELAARFPDWSAAPGHRLLLLDLGNDGDSTDLPVPAGGEATADTLAYLIYTSGSTGRPKGVAVAHRPIVRLVWGADYCRLTSADRVAQASNTSFDAATFEIWGPLLNGGTLVGLDREVTLAPRLLAAALAAERVTTLFLTTALFNQVAREEPAAFAGLTHLLFGGEAVDPAWVRRVFDSGAPQRLLHVYGPTESTTFSTWTRLAEVPLGASTLPIGGPLSRTTQQVLDTWGAPALPGAVGELALGGAGLAWGYWERPAITAERFVPAPYLSSGGGRFYKTGDRVRLLATGGVEFVGRADAQIKLRGYRIELPEIEAALARHPEVGEAVVLVVGDSQADKQLVACLEPRAETTLTVAELKAHLALTLPPFMVPAGFLVLPKLPLNPNGKVDRKALAAALPANLFELEREGEAYRPPKTPTEALLAELWADLLAVLRVGVDDNFFALGGHSLLAIRLASRMRQTFAVEVPLATLFETANLEELAVAIEASRATGRTALPSIEARPRRQREPLSFAQERLWFLDQLAPGAPNYNVLAGVRLAGRLVPRVLADALGRVVRRHEVLRTVFGAQDGKPYQEVMPPAVVPLPEIDLSGLPAVPRDAVLRGLVAAEGRRGFDLARGPLLRARWVRLAENNHAVLLNLHHIVADGWSIDVLTAELGAALGGEPVPPPLPVQGADVARWQREHLAGTVLAEQIRAWRRLLAEAPVFLPLPTDRPRPPIQSFRGGTVSFRLGAAERDALLALGRREGATLFITLLAAFQALLGRLADQRRLVVGTPIANRSRAELEGLIGLFVNNLALPADLSADSSGEPGFSTLLARLRPTVLEAYAHADLPFERLVDELAVPRSLAHHPLYQAVFSLLERPPLRLELPGLTLEPLAIGDESAKLDLQLTVADQAEGLYGTLRYSTELFDSTTARRWARHWQVLLRAVAANATAPLAALELLDEAERSQLLCEWNDTGRFEAEPIRLDTLLARQVALRPEALALTAGDEWLSYRGLLEAADELAATLRAHGAGPERLVALCLPRGLAFVVAVVATFRAGAAYLPLDPGHPADRLAFMLADSGAGLAVTEGGNSSTTSVTGSGFKGAVVSALSQPPGRAGASGSTAQPGEPGLPSQLAYVIYTSGSTGQPNGVLVPHQAAAALIRSAVTHFGVTSSSRLVQVVSTSFDASVLEIWMALAAGARLILPDEETRRSPTALTHFLNRHAVTTAVLTPAVAALLDRRELPALTSVSVGGESCPAEVANRWAPLGTEHSFRLLNCYGPTETAIYAAVLSCQGPFEREPALGRPVPEARIHLLDRAGRLALPGVAGQLVIAGAGLARGYLGRPALTAERFRPDPFAARFGTSGGRIYASGDLARQLADGRLEFLGRLDQQVKIRGLRIELGEVQAACAADAAVAEAVVTATTDSRGDKSLTAYLVPVSMADAPGLAARLRVGLTSRLPEYMIPAAFVVLPSLPMTPTGKIDRRALPAPEAEEGEILAPRDLLELALTRLWAETLDRPAVGIHSNFFALGGHSLLAVRLLARVRQELGAELPLSSLFTAGTVAEMASLIRERGAQGGGPSDPLVRLNRGAAGSPATGRPLFLVHPAGGDVLCYAALANRLGDRPVYGLKAQGLGEAEGEPLSTLEDLAASYLAAIRRLQPAGPYALGGWSLGGLVAFEMARQVSAEGERVELLAVIDTTAGIEAAGIEAEATGAGADDVGLLLDVAAYVETLWGRPVPMKREDLLALAPEERLEAFVARLASAGVLPPGADAETIRRLLKVYAANLEAARRYQPGEWEGDLLLLPARDRQLTGPPSPTGSLTGLLADPTLGWGRLVRHVTVAPVAGHHLSLIAEPQVESLAHELEAALGACEAREVEVQMPRG